MVYRPHDLYESDSSPCDINYQKDYTAWRSYDKNNLLLFIDILFLDKSLMIFQIYTNVSQYIWYIGRVNLYESDSSPCD
jgi:hypothetical protein